MVESNMYYYLVSLYLDYCVNACIFLGCSHDGTGRRMSTQMWLQVYSCVNTHYGEMFYAFCSAVKMSLNLDHVRFLCVWFPPFNFVMINSSYCLIMVLSDQSLTSSVCQVSLLHSNSVVYNAPRPSIIQCHCWNCDCR